MDTVYCHLETRRVKVSGGADLLTVAPRAAAPVPREGRVLDFESCRRRLEERRAAEEGEEAPEEAPEVGRAPRWSPSLLLELCASAAVLLTALSASLAFLRLA